MPVKETYLTTKVNHCSKIMLLYIFTTWYWLNSDTRKFHENIFKYLSKKLYASGVWIAEHIFPTTFKMSKSNINLFKEFLQISSHITGKGHKE